MFGIGIYSRLLFLFLTVIIVMVELTSANNFFSLTAIDGKGERISLSKYEDARAILVGKSGLYI
jgi:hypothetical protein